MVLEESEDDIITHVLGSVWWRPRDRRAWHVIKVIL